jgi:hypothetical protein
VAYLYQRHLLAKLIPGASVAIEGLETAEEIARADTYEDKLKALVDASAPTGPRVTVKEETSAYHHNIAPHDEQPKRPRPTGYQSHHPEQQTALGRALGKEQYDPNKDITILIIEKTEHKKTLSPQCRQRQDPLMHAKLGTPEALGQAFVMLNLAGVRPSEALEVILKHAGYLFEASRRSH